MIHIKIYSKIIARLITSCAVMTFKYDRIRVFTATPTHHNRPVRISCFQHNIDIYVAMLRQLQFLIHSLCIITETVSIFHTYLQVWATHESIPSGATIWGVDRHGNNCTGARIGHIECTGSGNKPASIENTSAFIINVELVGDNVHLVCQWKGTTLSKEVNRENSCALAS